MDNNKMTTIRLATIIFGAFLYFFGLVQPAFAQAGFPSRPITLVATAPAGGGIDFLARLLAEPLTKVLGQSVVVENKPGASGGIGSQYVAAAKPDGYTLLVTYSGFHVGTPNLFKNLQWDPINDFTPVAMIATSPQVIVVRPTLAISSIQELITYAKANPGKLNYASSGNGSVGHVAAELFKQVTNTDIVHIPYKGASTVIPALMAGQVDLYIETPGGLMAPIQSGALKAIAVTGKKRLPTLAAVPTTTEAGLANYDLDSWFAILAPAKTPDSIVNRLNTEINKIFSEARITQRLSDIGLQFQAVSPAQVAQVITTDLENWRKIVSETKITVD
jgi:tripartite-type tricarboxylate transporter receptor subunit TctC